MRGLTRKKTVNEIYAFLWFIKKWYEIGHVQLENIIWTFKKVFISSDMCVNDQVNLLFSLQSTLYLFLFDFFIVLQESQSTNKHSSFQDNHSFNVHAFKKIIIISTNGDNYFKIR